MLIETQKRSDQIGSDSNTNRLFSGVRCHISYRMPGERIDRAAENSPSIPQGGQATSHFFNVGDVVDTAREDGKRVNFVHVHDEPTRYIKGIPVKAKFSD